jgi:hypothetical protein
MLKLTILTMTHSSQAQIDHFDYDVSRHAETDYFDHDTNQPCLECVMAQIVQIWAMKHSRQNETPSSSR